MTAQPACNKTDLFGAQAGGVGLTRGNLRLRPLLPD